MRKIYHLGRISGLEISARPSVILSFMLIWAASSATGIWAFDLTPLSAMFGGLAAATLHYGSELWHQLGHASAASRTGFPMKGIVFWGALSTSLYPRQEGKLPAAIHIRRALGGPLWSFIMAIAAGLLALALRPLGGLLPLVAAFLFLDNLLVLTFGALLPLGFTDGSTLLYWLKRA